MEVDWNSGKPILLLSPWLLNYEVVYPCNCSLLSSWNIKVRVDVKLWTFRSPDILDLRNENGNGWTFYKRDGILRRLSPGQTPEDDAKVIRKVQNMELRHDDVMIVAYPKCGRYTSEMRCYTTEYFYQDSSSSNASFDKLIATIVRCRVTLDLQD